MFYRCKNCGGNVLYHPEKKKMICESWTWRKNAAGDTAERTSYLR